MTNYNDGKWHGWNGGECPVHPETIVEVVTYVIDEGTGTDSTLAKWVRWEALEGAAANIIAFRVVKEHREPREWWLFGPYIYDQDPRGLYCGEPAIRVREVLE